VTESRIVAELRPAILRWSGSLRHALQFTCPGAGTCSESGATQACHWLVGLGLLIGLAYTGVYRAVWRQFGEVRGLQLMPAVAVWLLDVGLCGALAYFGAARTLGRVLAPSAPVDAAGGDRPVRYPIEVVGLVVLVVLKLVVLLAIPQGIAGWPGPGDWRSHFNWMYARPHFRPLILAPMWGRWAILLVGSIGRLRDRGDVALSRFCGSLSAARVLLWMVPVTVLTSVYCGRLGRWMFGCIIACLVLGGTYLYGVIAVRRQGGQTRETILGAGVIAELIFLVAYEAFAAHIYAS
jgi:hypothetical protein